MPRESTLDGFTTKVEAADRFGLSELDTLATVTVTTTNSAYRLVVLDPPQSRILIQGGRFFSEPTEARLAGTSFGGRLLKLSWLGRGLRLELSVGGQKVITSRVKSIVEQDAAVPDPF